MGHCCFCAAVSQAPDLVFILILGSFLPIVAINEISTLLYPVVVAIVGAVFLTTKIKTRDSLILIIFQLCSHQTYASYPYFFISFTFLKQPVQDTEGRVGC